MQVSLLTQRRGQFVPYGVDGGQPGQRGVNTLIRQGTEPQDHGGTASLEVNSGDIIRIETPGGGGWVAP